MELSKEDRNEVLHFVREQQEQRVEIIDFMVEDPGITTLEEFQDAVRDPVEDLDKLRRLEVKLSDGQR